VAAHRIDRVPAIVFESRGIGRLRMLGVPAGYEFMSVIEAIQLASTGASGLSEESKAQLAQLREPIDIQVFSTPT
jgi:hypothetical protein